MPDRDSFIIRENKLQKVNIKTGSKYVSNLRSVIGSVSELIKWMIISLLKKMSQKLINQK